MFKQSLMIFLCHLCCIGPLSTLQGEEGSVQAPGWPSRDAQLDALPGFQNPPLGYGEVPFWWWSGEDLDVDRLLWQLRELHQKGISGVQVNYSHYDTPGWLSDHDDPALFTEDWWQIYSRVSEECVKLEMGIGLSTYTIDWPRGAKNLFYQLFYSKPELNAIALKTGAKHRLRGGETMTVAVTDGQFAVRAYQRTDGQLMRGGLDLSSLVKDGSIRWTAPAGEWEIWTFDAVPKAGSLNPLMANSGETVIQGFYQKFEDNNQGKSSKGLNYFFNDELHIGLDKFAWNPDFPEEFRRRKGYDLLEVLPAMWVEMGDITPKVRMDYADVRMSLMEERYFKPIYNWHASRGIIFGCDPGSRGLKPNEFGDYFRANRWYSAPGHDTPGGNADPIKGKVSSSIANLNQRPRVWLEGYHSMGWSATPERLMFATRENYLYGCTLLNLHGLYYTTYGSHWEWAPPCYHFRMPYWEHMGTFLKYFERLSYLMSQGHTVADVAIIYPVAPYEAEMDGDAAKNTAFDLGKKLLAAGINFEFIDHQSLARAEVKDGHLVLPTAGASYQALIFPGMEAVRWKSIEKAAAFAQAGGTVLAVGALPTVTDRAGRNDALLENLNEQAFAAECRLPSTEAALERIRHAFVQDIHGLSGTVRTLHRKIGPRDAYLVMDAKPGDVVEFRAKGAVEIWDPWTGAVRPLRVVRETATGTQVELTLQPYEAQLVMFTPGAKHHNPAKQNASRSVVKTLPNEWTVSFVPTMDNRYGDFRLPVTPENHTIGLEARRFAWARETPELAIAAMLPHTDDSAWQTQLHGYGPQLYLLGPIPQSVDAAKLDAELAQLKRVDPTVPVALGEFTFNWQPYEFSWRYGKEGDPGHQGYHGLKGTISEDFIRLGQSVEVGPGVTVLAAEAHQRYYLWSSVTLAEPVVATLHVGDAVPVSLPNTSQGVAPAAVFINGEHINDFTQPVSLKAGTNPLLIRYDDFGQSHVVLRRQDTPLPEATPTLAMRWYQDPGVIPFDAYAGETSAEWFRFLSAPATTAIQVQALSREPIQAWLNGKPMLDRGDGRFEVQQATATAAVVAVRLLPESGKGGGAAIPEPILVETSADGIMPLGDWSQLGILNNYSGGVRYRTTLTLSEQEVTGAVELDLGKVTATAEVSVNGKQVGVRVAPPWTFDLSGTLKVGENEIEVLVFNTLSNHYQTIPSHYRGDPVSGLFGPVKILSFSDELIRDQ
jgi:hypothetical protein